MSELKVDRIEPALANKITLSPSVFFENATGLVKFLVDSTSVTLTGPLKLGTTIGLETAGTSRQILTSQGPLLPPIWTDNFPIGGIIMWSGNSATVPSGWAICNGATVSGITTPDLTNKFVVSVGSSYTVGDKGGSNTVTLTASQVPTSITNLTNHKHKYGAFCSVNAGTNTPRPYMQSATNTAGATIISAQNGGELEEHDAGGGETQDSGSMVATTGTVVDSSGNPMPTIGSGDQPHENRPPYYALYYIMKVS